jgi:hypothetical protein
MCFTILAPQCRDFPTKEPDENAKRNISSYFEVVLVQSFTNFTCQINPHLRI